MAGIGQDGLQALSLIMGRQRERDAMQHERAMQEDNFEFQSQLNRMNADLSARENEYQNLLNIMTNINQQAMDRGIAVDFGSDSQLPLMTRDIGSSVESRISSLGEIISQKRGMIEDVSNRISSFNQGSMFGGTINLAGTEGKNLISAISEGNEDYINDFVNKSISTLGGTAIDADSFKQGLIGIATQHERRAAHELQQSELALSQESILTARSQREAADAKTFSEMRSITMGFAEDYERLAKTQGLSSSVVEFINRVTAANADGATRKEKGLPEETLRELEKQGLALAESMFPFLDKFYDSDSIPGLKRQMQQQFMNAMPSVMSSIANNFDAFAMDASSIIKSVHEKLDKLVSENPEYSSLDTEESRHLMLFKALNENKITIDEFARYSVYAFSNIFGETWESSHNRVNLISRYANVRQQVLEPFNSRDAGVIIDRIHEQSRTADIDPNGYMSSMRDYMNRNLVRPSPRTRGNREPDMDVYNEIRSEISSQYSESRDSEKEILDEYIAARTEVRNLTRLLRIATTQEQKDRLNRRINELMPILSDEEGSRLFNQYERNRTLGPLTTEFGGR